MTTSHPAAKRERGPHPVSWLIGCVLVGWVIAYNIMRLAGSTPAAAAWASLAIGGVLGLAVFAGGVVTLRRLAASGRVVRQGAADIPAPAEMDEGQRRLARAVAPALGAFAALALVMGVALGVDWLGADPGDRATTLIILAAWNLLVAVWVGDEAIRAFRSEVEGLEAVALGAALTAVLAGVGISREYMAGGQVALIVVAGIAGAAAATVVWRLRGGTHVPVAAPAVVIVAALSIILPIAT